MDNELLRLLSLAAEGLGVLKGMVHAIPDNAPFLDLFVRKEALCSSQIEGIKATIDDILDPTLPFTLNQEAVEVLDTLAALAHAARELENGGVPRTMLELLKDAHAVLFAHSSGSEKKPGEFRTSQNWIGATGCSLQTASYVPPNPSDMAAALDDFDGFISQEQLPFDPLISAALIHYQFETIHPFLDGNGRIGRLLTLLFLMERKVISGPYLYASCFLKCNRADYYAHLTSVREYGTYEAWVKFFLKAVCAAAEDAAQSLHRLQAVRENSLQKIFAAVPGKVARERRQQFLAYLERKPIFEIKETSEEVGWTFPTVAKFVKEFEQLGILTETTGRTRGRMFSFEPYLEVLRRGAEPL